MGDPLIVGPGKIVFFEAEMSHGFKALEKGMIFLSINGGIVDNNFSQWDIHDFEKP